MDLDGWVERVTRSTTSLLEHFEERFGYPPDSNVVVTKSRTGRVGLDGEGHGDADVLPVAVSEFFDLVEEVSLPDVWNGYFLGPVSRVIASYTGSAPRWLTVRGQRMEIVVIGSDGGGALFVVGVEDGSVMRVEGGAMNDGVLGVARDDQVRHLAPSFAGFLELFAGELESFGEGTSTPSF